MRMRDTPAGIRPTVERVLAGGVMLFIFLFVAFFLAGIAAWPELPAKAWVNSRFAGIFIPARAEFARQIAAAWPIREIAIGAGIVAGLLVWQWMRLARRVGTKPVVHRGQSLDSARVKQQLKRMG